MIVKTQNSMRRLERLNSSFAGCRARSFYQP
jgi:hypothetical protein